MEAQIKFLETLQEQIDAESYTLIKQQTQKLERVEKALQQTQGELLSLKQKEQHDA